MMGWRKHTRRTTVAGGLAFAWSSILVVVGLLLLLGLPLAIKASESGGYCESIDHPGPCAGVLALFGPGLVVLSVAIWCLVASVGYRRGRRWARSAVVVTFALWAVGALVALIFGRRRVGVGAGCVWKVVEPAAGLVAEGSQFATHAGDDLR